MNKQLRIPFPDYTPEYQDAAMLRDAALHKQAAPAVRGSLPVSRGMDEGR